jgi:vacuolar-type H+-ATPase subunit F/Vma7
LGRIALLADREIATYFKLTGVRSSWVVKDRDEAERRFQKLYSDGSISLIIVTEPVYDWIQPLLTRTRKEYPLVVSIPGKGGPKERVDMLAELIKRTVGVELKVR